jgi:hypothetical protein
VKYSDGATECVEPRHDVDLGEREVTEHVDIRLAEHDPGRGEYHNVAAEKVMAVVQIGEQAGLNGFPAEGLARAEVGRREVHG